MQNLTVSCLLCFSVACTDPSGTAPDPIREALVDDVAALAATGVVGVQVEHLHAGVARYASAGMADLVDGRPVLQGDRFRIASTTKTFTAALVLMLADDGVLSLDDTVEQWLPGLVADHGNDGSRMTLRQLLQHRSGLGNHVDDLSAELGGAASARDLDALLRAPWDPRELVALATSRAPVFAPGDGFAYTDTGYVVLGLVVEAATGQGWADVLDDLVLAPLALSDTLVPTAPDLSEPMMHGYAELPFADGPLDVTAIHPSSLGAAAAIVSTPADTNAFFSALLGGDLVGPARLAEMKDGLGVEGELRYGLGLARVPLSCGGDYFMHSGDTLGFHTRNGTSGAGDRSVTIALSGDGDFEAEAAALVDRALCL